MGDSTIYSYVRGNPVSRIDPYGLIELIGIPNGPDGTPYTNSGPNPGGTPGMNPDGRKSPARLPPIPPVELPPVVACAARIAGAIALALYPSSLACGELPQNCEKRENPKLYYERQNIPYVRN